MRSYKKLAGLGVHLTILVTNFSAWHWVLMIKYLIKYSINYLVFIYTTTVNRSQCEQKCCLNISQRLLHSLVHQKGNGQPHFSCLNAKYTFFV